MANRVLGLGYSSRVHQWSVLHPCLRIETAPMNLGWLRRRDHGNWAGARPLVEAEGIDPVRYWPRELHARYHDTRSGSRKG